MIDFLRGLFRLGPRPIYEVRVEVHLAGRVISSFTAVTTHNLRLAQGVAAMLQQHDPWDGYQGRRPVVQIIRGS